MFIFAQKQFIQRLWKKKYTALSGTFFGAECFSSKEGPNGSWCRAGWWGVCPSAQHVRERAGVGSGSEEGLALVSLAVRVCVCVQLHVGLGRFGFAFQ